ncbi:MAG: HAD-IA family hydrolase, partial [Bacilli bacterium]|nr:HAD-IA family hydrolase [Bacilli bacterium]
YKRHKPHPEPILLACQELGVPADSSVLYVGDSLQDAECAKAAGVDYVLIDREGELSDYPGWKIASLEELL